MMADPAPGSTWCAYGALFFLDLILWLSLWTALLCSQDALFMNPTWLLAFRAFSWVLLHTVSSATLDKNVHNLLKPWVALLCFIPPVFDTVQTLVLGGKCGFSPVPVPSMVALSAVTGTLVHLMWDKAFPGKKVKKEQEARVLLVRVIHYSKPDFLHLGAAFFFLILAALCKFNTCAHLWLICMNMQYAFVIHMHEYTIQCYSMCQSLVCNVIHFS